jgi:hypothetical protein
MGEKIDPKTERAEWQDVVYSNMIQTEALAQLMVEKGFMTKEEYTQRIQKVHQQFMQQHPSAKQG